MHSNSEPAFGALDPDMAQDTCFACRRTREDYLRANIDPSCAAHMTTEGDIYGTYGSTVADMTKFRFVSAHARVASGIFGTGSICDDCIIQLINHGHIIETEREKPTCVYTPMKAKWRPLNDG